MQASLPHVVVCALGHAQASCLRAKLPDDSLQMSDTVVIRHGNHLQSRGAKGIWQGNYSFDAFSFHLLMQPSPKRVGSSDVKKMTSMGRCGLKPLSARALRAAIPPITPRVPSYAPARGMASQCDPVITAAAPSLHAVRRYVWSIFSLQRCAALCRWVRGWLSPDPVA